MSKFYITTAIAYINARPHIGYAMELIHADALARYHRMLGDDTYFLTGTDEHGSKMAKTAAENNTPVKEFADKNVIPFMDLTKKLNLSNDDFIRTTFDKHKKGAQKLWQKMFDADKIEKRKYKGLYCIGCEAYVHEKDLVDGKCPNHDKAPEVLEEEDYFFRLSDYKYEIEKLIREDKLKIYPEARKNEMLNIIQESEDVSFSRPKEKLTWGVTVPNDEDQVMYVWCDALSNYITAIGYEEETDQFKKYWPADFHIIGKDILRFHAGVWIGMLLAAKLPIPKAIGVHGFVTSEGRKMSKSLGNVIDPFTLIEEFGVDPVRYYFLREIPTTEDGDYSRERFEGLYESELVNSISNLSYRVLSMTEKYFEGRVPENTGESLEKETKKTWKTYQEKIESYDLKTAIESVLELAAFGNKYVETEKPWELAKNDKEKLGGVIYNLLELLRHLSLLLTPFIPETAKKLQAQINWDPGKTPFKEITKWGGLASGQEIKKGEPLFTRKQKAQPQS